MTTQTSQAFGLAAVQAQASSRVTQAFGLLAYGPPNSKSLTNTQTFALIAYAAGEPNVTTQVSQFPVLASYFEGQPAVARQAAWTFILDGHRFYVLPLGPEGDWAYDTTTKQWCKLQSIGFDGINFTHGTMWGLRIMGGDSLYTYLLELDPTQPLDEQWRQVEHMVTGGIYTRSRDSIGVGELTLTASVSDPRTAGELISMAFSDDNGVTWSDEFDIPLTDESTQTLIWSALGSFSAPGRVFRISDTAGPVRLDGADAVLFGDPTK